MRYLARGFSVPGDHPGQMSNGLRWPYGPVALITPFNFPLEIPALQLMGALYMGNKPLLHCDHRVRSDRGVGVRGRCVCVYMCVCVYCLGVGGGSGEQVVHTKTEH